MFAVFLLVCILIAYGSLYPFSFHPAKTAANPLRFLLHAWPSHLDRDTIKDIGLNLLLYFPLGVSGLFAFAGRRWNRFLVPVATGFLLSTAIEIIQLYDASRITSALDVTCNVLGTTLGVAVAYALSTRHVPEPVRRRPDAALLLACWLMWQVFPIFPIWHVFQLGEKIARLDPAPSLVPTVLVAWLALACILEALLPGRTIQALLLALTLIPAKLLIANRAPSWPEFAGALLAIFLWATVLRRIPSRLRVVTAIIIGLILLRQLYPFHVVQAAQPFLWKPFAGTLSSGSLPGYVIVLEKGFLYTSAVWLLWRSGMPLATATAVISGGLFATEIIQIHLRGRVPEVTDAIVAGLGGVSLIYLRRHCPVFGIIHDAPVESSQPAAFR